MAFKDVLTQVVKWLQQDGRVSYLALKRQFDLDDDYLSDLKEALSFSHPQACDEEGRGLIWTGDPREHYPDTQRETDWENPAQMPLVQHHHIVQTISADTATRSTYGLG